MQSPSYVPLGDLSSKRVIFRLQVKDFNLALFSFCMAHFVFKKMGITPFALIVPILVLVPLAFIRNRYRNHVIRDTIGSLFHRGKLYVSAYTRT